MLLVQKNVDLQAYNTLALQSIVSHFVEINSLRNVEDALIYADRHHLNVMILSGGSNVLLPENIDALVMKMNIQGVETLDEDETSVWLKVGAGQVWHDFVLFTTAQKYYGLQNLALIPGLVGAAPVQNIGAYGVEVGEFIEYVEVFDRHYGYVVKLTAEECQFSYRHSIFKEDPNRYIIVAVVFKLRKNADLKIGYGDLKQAMGDELTAENLQQQVIAIRKAKLPNPAEFANVGSFFKNPMLDSEQFQLLQKDYPSVPNYLQNNGQVKVAAGWLIEQAGWKGKRLQQVGMFEKQALVLVNYGQATLSDVQQTYRQVQKDVMVKFNVFLEPEPVLFNEIGQISEH